MKTKYIIVILFFLNLFRTNAQTMIKDISELIGIDNIQGAYYKDTQNKLDPYVGTYVYTNGATSLKFVFKKVLYKNQTYYTEDVLVGEYQYIVNGVEIANTLNRFNLNYTAEEIFKHSVKGNDIYDGQTYCNDCAPNEEHFYTYLYDSNAQGGAVFDIKKTTQNGKEAIRVIIGWSLRQQKDTDPPLPNPSLPGGVYLMLRGYDNQYLYKDFIKNDCPPGVQGSRESYEVLAGKHTSTLSQADADQKALDDMNAYGQANANAKGWCVFKNKALVNVPFTRNNCLGKIGSTVLYSLQAGWYTSTKTQEEADGFAMKAGQDYANGRGTCN